MPNYKIVGSDLQALVCDLASGERVIAETGHLLLMTDGLALDTTTGGGLWAGVKRAIGGSSLFVNEVRADSPGQVIFASPSPGHIQELDILPEREWLCQPHVFLCSDDQVQIAAAFTKRFGAGLFGGAGFILQSLKGRGKAFVHVGGASIKFDLAANQTLRVETGALAAFEASVTYDIEMVQGLKSILFSGEGLWFAHLRGPGTVYVQSLGISRLASALAAYMPTSSDSGGVAGVMMGGVLGSLLGGGNSGDHY